MEGQPLPCIGVVRAVIPMEDAIFDHWYPLQRLSTALPETRVPSAAALRLRMCYRTEVSPAKLTIDDFQLLQVRGENAFGLRPRTFPPCARP